MHTDLSPHLHTEECIVLINELKDCYASHPVLQFVGYCNAFDTAMRKCLKAERLTRQKAHNEAALKKNAAIRARIREQEKAENNI